ncbi:hypothetical protein [Streptomyces gardneri]|uniref:Uncharacterized protein n=1 Tax=Streptomyces gardneri TaxID=66892 RepID=A0A4Y3RI84_9ACTN|nr:hypothetical protein SGA01_29700 [Streptomyces gardneri]GHH12942.1 hypothetical protein GCM10017674_59530 [Streptomyces gardneri]
MSSRTSQRIRRRRNQCKWANARSLASLIGPRVSELCLLDVTDIRWDLGTFGKVLLHGKGRRG